MTTLILTCIIGGSVRGREGQYVPNLGVKYPKLAQVRARYLTVGAYPEALVGVRAR